ncbi:MAG: hypothetical protein SGCHY_004874 [Lobulomycetales sp.]
MGIQSTHRLTPRAPTAATGIAVRDLVSARTIAHFPAHNNPVAALAVNPAQTLIVSASTAGTSFRVWEIPGPVPADGVMPLPVCIYKLVRGYTLATVVEISFSLDSAMVLVSTKAATRHVYAIDPIPLKRSIAKPGSTAYSLALVNGLMDDLPAPSVSPVSHLAEEHASIQRSSVDGEPDIRMYSSIARIKAPAFRNPQQSTAVDEEKLIASRILVDRLDATTEKITVYTLTVPAPGAPPAAGPPSVSVYSMKARASKPSPVSVSPPSGARSADARAIAKGSPGAPSGISTSFPAASGFLSAAASALAAVTGGSGFVEARPVSLDPGSFRPPDASAPDANNTRHGGQSTAREGKSAREDVQQDKRYVALLVDLFCSWVSAIEIRSYDHASAGVPLWMRSDWTFSVFVPAGDAGRTPSAPTSESGAAAGGHTGKQRKKAKKLTSAAGAPSGGYLRGADLPRVVDLVVPRRQRAITADAKVSGDIAQAIHEEQAKQRLIGDDVELSFEDAFQISN